MSFRGMETSMQDGVFYQIVSSGLKTVCEDGDVGDQRSEEHTSDSSHP